MNSTTKKPLAGKYLDLLVEGNQGEYGSRSEAVAAVTLHMINQGWTWEDFSGAMMDVDNHELAKWFHYKSNGGRRTSNDRINRLHTMWDGRKSYARDHPVFQDKSHVLQEIGIIRSSLKANPLMGRTSLTDTLVLEHVHSLATEFGRINPFVSVRSLVTACNIGTGTASRALNRLVKAHWLTKETTSEVDKAYSYRLTVPLYQSHTVEEKAVSEWNTVYPEGRTDYVPLRDSVISDTFTLLGRTAASVYSAVSSTPMLATDIMAIAKVSKATVHRHLKSLEGTGLIKNELKLWSLTEKTLDEAAVEMDAVGLADKRNQTVELQREAFSHPEVKGKMQFNYDRDKYGMRTAIQNASLREQERVREMGVDPVTGEILEDYTDTLSAVVSGSSNGGGALTLVVAVKPVEGRTKPVWTEPERKEGEDEGRYDRRRQTSWNAFVKRMEDYKRWKKMQETKTTVLSPDTQARLDRYRKVM